MADPTRSFGHASWVESANKRDGDFPLANLPWCAFASEGEAAKIGVGIGDFVFDMKAAAATSLLQTVPQVVRVACAASTLNALMACGREELSALRQTLLALFAENASAMLIEKARALLHPTKSVRFCMPVAVGNYTDFYVSIQHATNVGRLFRPDQPLLPNYKYVPIGYHGRASSVQVSGTPLVRPRGQIKLPNAVAPVFAPSRQLDFELELGAYITRGNALGEPIQLSEADGHIFGLTLLNDWSARDIQSWEYQPLGPFLGKSFLTSVSPWIVPLDALAPFRVAVTARPEGDPEPLPYLASASGDLAAFDIHVEAFLSTQQMRDAGHAPAKLTSANAKHLYWSFAQMVTHHSSNGCNLLAGDLLGSGTISGADDPSGGSLLELTLRGVEPVTLASGETRGFLEDGDEVILRAFCQREGFARIGFGECRGIVQPAIRGDKYGQ